MPSISTPAPRAPRVIVLSPGEPNVATGTTPDRVYAAVARAELHAFQIADPLADILIFPGGGYVQLVHDREGTEVARWLNGAGFNAHVLVHRLPGAPGPGGQVQPPTIALDDAVAALTHLDADRPWFALGLSSGGHLAGTLTCRAERPPAGLLIAYGPINANHRDYKAPAGKPDYPPPEKQAFYDAWPIALASEPHGIPPCPVFLAYALHDHVVPVEHALNAIITARDLNLDLDAHIFGRAPHGFATRDLKGSEADWPGLAERWMRRKLGDPA
ncbi:hypothetical protein MMB232_02269 [Brevundimonas subvibrioides]|uniref:alpha/beta hydrolase n=1 Tax=Brevundimonas subvibrioides TaxID=74313 RepID=UPI0032D5B0E5